ncbi:MAG: ParB/RepB/Spo0J family partition protein [Firmicutes bacterium]|nr:ParB/RepB/Spo0J family partition protein [Bacillota bacterium]
MAAKKGGLGRGLDALFADAVPVNNPESEEKETKAKSSKKKAAAEETVAAGDAVQYINIHDIMPNVNQPRKTFNEEKIEELSKSIKEHGIIQPIVVRKKKTGYEIVAGERRWRAAMKAELSEVPCLIRELSDEQNMLIAIIENMQREDLNPVEEAEGLNQMIVTFGMTQEQVSKSVGKSRPYIANSLRLLKLPEYIKENMAEGKLSAAHGRTLITVEDETVRKSICDKIIEEGLSVRAVEKLVSEIGKDKKKRPAARVKNPDVAKVEADLKEALGTRVTISQSGKKGKIEIEYFSRDELERLIELLKTLG